MSKKEQNAPLNETVENVNNETVNNENVNQVENELTPAQQKATQVLRARLPKLADFGLNFEKRTGNFFKASLVNVLDEDGNQVFEDGQPKQKLSRLVEPIENEDGALLPKYSDCMDEIKAKRAAAFVLAYDSTIEKLTEKREDLVKQIEAIDNELAEASTKLTTSEEIVMGVELPEKSQRENVTAKLTKANDMLEKMRAMLLAAGLSEEEIEAQLG